MGPMDIFNGPLNMFQKEKQLMKILWAILNKNWWACTSLLMLLLRFWNHIWRAHYRGSAISEAISKYSGVVL